MQDPASHTEEPAGVKHRVSKRPPDINRQSTPCSGGGGQNFMFSGMKVGRVVVKLMYVVASVQNSCLNTIIMLKNKYVNVKVT